jgi:hypothetical protein
MGLAASRVAALNGGGNGDSASAGNGGRANSSADGGIVVIGEINSGDNQGNTISTGDIGGGSYGECGSASIDGGNVDNSTNINIDAGGGTGIGDASGGSDNLAAVSGSDDGNNGGGGLRGLIHSRYGFGAGGDVASAGNGGVAGASADGGIVVINEINSGGNQGNMIGVGDLCAGGGGSVTIGGGTVDNSTNIDIDAGGGTAISDASGGSGNLAAATGNDDRGNGDHGNNDRGNGGRGGLRGLIQSRYGLGGRGGLAGRIASAGNGGRANSSADGGIVVIGKVNSGGNRGNTINVGDIGGGAHGECAAGPVTIDGGNVDNSTNIDIDASGGTAIGDASGGNGNLAAATGNDDGGGGRGGPIRSRYGLGARGNGGGYGGDAASAGNGGIAGVSADGGIVVIDEINSGGNQGNTVEVGDICVAPVFVPEAPAKPGKPVKPGNPAKPGKTIAVPTGGPARGGGGGKVRVTKVPSTGVGYIPTSPLPPNTVPFAALPVWREDEDGEDREDNTIR